MGLILKEALRLDVLKHFKIVAGEKGLYRPVEKVGILDYESGDMITDTFIKGELTLTTLLAIKDDISGLYSMVEKLIQAETACLAIKPVCFDWIPDEVKKLADEHDYPIFFFREPYFEDIITAINDVVKEHNQIDRFEMRIEHMLSHDMNPYQIRNLAYEINPKFEDIHKVIYIKLQSEKECLNKRKELMAYTEEISGISIIPFRDGLLLVLTSKTEADLIKSLEDLKPILNRKTEEIYQGESSLYRTIEMVKMSVKESLYALEYSCICKKKHAKFDEMGVDRMLMPMASNPFVMAYYNSLIRPIMDYDRENGSELLQTAETYIRLSGDIKKTSDAMFQHGNTIRYRIEKVRNIIRKHNGNTFNYEELAIAIHLHALYTIK